MSDELEDLVLDWSAYRDSGFGDPYADIPKHGEDFAKAVSVCINSMQCLRPIERGVMCPSFRVTGNPDHSPGGRVRLLKEALNSSQPQKALFSPDLQESMALCVSCKGCKRECDSNVDMASIKSEYIAQTASPVLPLREKFFASLPQLLNEHKRIIIPFIEFRNRSRFVSFLGERLFRVSGKKQLPVPAKQSFYESYEPNASVYRRFSEQANYSETDNDLPLEHKKVLLMIDTFSNYFDPSVARSATNVLKYLGYEVYIHSPHNSINDQPLCCGRTYYSNGDMDNARSEAKRLLKGLAPMIESGVPIIGLEPSCLLMLRDEYKTMNLGPMAEQASKLAFLFEEFLAKEFTTGRIQRTFEEASDDKPVLVHGHCHQKSVGAMKSLRKVLRLVPKLKFDFIESTCCGGAGSFSFQSENHDISEKMAELSLMPAIRSAENSILVSNGFSCRCQISDLTNKSSNHIATLLERYIG